MIRAILTDIEGTTSSIRFVHDVLFPYAREHMAEFVRCNAEDVHVVPHLNDVRLEAGTDLDLEGIIRQLISWIDADEKATPLKALQGMIWEAGYQKGDFTGHIYPDAARRLRTWHGAGISLYIFSSGSTQAQKLLFGHSDVGDLTPLFSGYYDTRTGNKRDPAAYRAIAADIGLPPEDILFLSDICEELDAAHTAGMHTTWLVRDGMPDGSTTHPQVAGFDDIEPAALG
jgi:enolase-phosphatase E1